MVDLKRNFKQELARSKFLASQVAVVVKKPACQCRRHEMWVQALAQEDTLEEGMASHSHILA